MASLKLVDAKPGGPPRPLNRHGMALWNRITSDFAIDDAAAVEMLLLACQSLDRAESCRASIDELGELGKVKGAVGREHPLLKTELQNRAYVGRQLERLGLLREPLQANGRPLGSWQHEPTTKITKA